MKKRIFASMFIALSMAGVMFAETTQTLIINGEPVEKVVGAITFDGDNVVLHFDNETESHDMNLVTLSLEYLSGVNALNVYSFKGKIEGGKLSVSGLEVEAPIQIFNLSGTIQTSSKADSDGNALIDISSFPGGIYILQSGNNCLKFLKH